MAGTVAKHPIECRVAQVSCQNLESLYLQQVKSSVLDGTRYVDKQEILRVFTAKAAQIIQDYVEQTD